MKPYIIFDMDGVIIDSETWYLSVLKQYLRERKIMITEKVLNACIGLSTEDFYLQNIESIKLNKEQFVNDYHQYINQYKKPDYKTLLFPHVKECFEELNKSGIDIMIASSSPREVIKSVLYETQLYPYVKCYLGAQDVHNKKPSPEIYLKAVSLQGYEPLFVVEDSYYGIQSAKSAGLKVIAYCQKQGYLDQSQSDKIIYNHLEILNWRIIYDK